MAMGNHFTIFDTDMFTNLTATINDKKSHCIMWKSAFFGLKPSKSTIKQLKIMFNSTLISLNCVPINHGEFYMNNGQAVVISTNTGYNGKEDPAECN